MAIQDVSAFSSRLLFVPLTYDFLLAVTFIIAPREKDGVTRPTPVGTGFVVSFPSAEVQNLRFEYVVTASHVVQGERETYARFRKREGGVHDLPIHDWVHHARADVALAALRGHGPLRLHLKHIASDMFIGPGTKPIGVYPGERVYFLGLFERLGSLGDQNVAMVRSGTLGAWEVGDLPVEAGSIEAQVNSGVGVVTPSQMIVETYDMEELSEDRERVEEREKERGDEGAGERVAGADDE